MSIRGDRFVKIVELAAGADAATTHCVFETNRMNGFAQGLNAAIEILSAENAEEASVIAAKYRSKMANVTGTTQENWRVGAMVPDENWIVK